MQTLFNIMLSSHLWSLESKGLFYLCRGVFTPFGSFSAGFSFFPSRMAGPFLHVGSSHCLLSCPSHCSFLTTACSLFCLKMFFCPLQNSVTLWACNLSFLWTFFNAPFYVIERSKLTTLQPVAYDVPMWDPYSVRLNYCWLPKAFLLVLWHSHGSVLLESWPKIRKLIGFSFRLAPGLLAPGGSNKCFVSQQFPLEPLESFFPGPV